MNTTAAQRFVVERTFERFTERARHVVVHSQEFAREVKHNFVGTEHLLVGLIREEEGVAARTLAALGITEPPVKTRILEIVGKGEEATDGHLPFTPRLRKVLDLALPEALSLGHNYIGTEHILLGLVRENEGVAARILLDLDADSEKIRNEVMRELSGRGTGRAPTAPPAARMGATERALSRLLASLIVAAAAALAVALADAPTWAWVMTFLIVHLTAPPVVDRKRVEREGRS